jgi:prepilin-type N-terminal cleavage/methylation domain-containing protein/prepilin-type processing-associated H-X9-DG protein
MSGFTLTELLVVLLIVVVLALLTFMGVTRAREQAISAADTAKFRQVGAAIASIAQENNGIIPHGNESKPGFGIPNTATSQNGPNRFNFHEVVDRFFPPPPKFNPGSIYNYETREGSESIYCSKAARPWPGYKPSASRKLPGPLWFSFNSNLNHGNWAGNLLLVPDQSKIVLCAETNHLGGEMRPKDRATFEDNVQTRYRVSRAGRTALYLFVDGHVEKLQGERGEAYYAANRNETNIWKWW